MNKIDRRHIYGIMLDTETTNTIIEEDKSLNMRFVLPYDIGFAIIDSYGRIYETHSFVNYDIFCQEKELMQSAYYAKKIPQYQEELKQGTRLLRNTFFIRNFLISKIKEYNCKFVCAHNAFFDLNGCNNILRWISKSKYRYFFPKSVDFWDTLKMARSVILPMPTYQKFCTENNFLTKNGKPQLTAEVLYKFISGQQDFKEAHTGLEDVLIEVEILKYCKRQHKKMVKKLFKSP